MAGRLLRHQLLDLTFPRVSQRLWGKQPTRGTHSEAVNSAFTSQLEAVNVLATSSGQEKNTENTSLYSLKRASKKQSHTTGSPAENDKRAMSFLEKKVDDLKLMVPDVDEADPTYGRYEPVYKEAELLDIYQDILNTKVRTPEPAESAVDEVQEQADDRRLVRLVTKRLIEHLPLEPGTSQSHTVNVESSKPIARYRWVVARLAALLEDTDLTKNPGTRTSQSETTQGVLPSLLEWTALIRECVRVSDGESAAVSLALMKKAGLEPDDNVITPVIAFYAREGDVAKTESILTRFASDTPNHLQRHHHIKAYINSTPSDTIPLSALSLLHKYENMNLAPPMKTYTSLISTLISTPSSLAKAQAWDLFSHMRYVAHPTPDAIIYRLMILACARTPPSGGTGDSEPQRALDLFTEMTIDNNIPPTRGVYTAVILACARSGMTKFVNEAFRLAKEMLDGHRDALGRPTFIPNNALFGSLLQGAKRIGDLSRTRWILAEMVKVIIRQHHARIDDGIEIPPQDEIILTEDKMVHVFHAYASYQVPFHRSATRIAKGQGDTIEITPPEPPPDPHKGSTGDLEGKVNGGDSNELATADVEPRFNSIPPQSREELLAEARNLFEGILHDTRHPLPSSSSDSSPMLFKGVHVSTQLLNAYLSVHYLHAKVSVARDLFRNLFEEVGDKRNFLSYVEALEACARWSCIRSRREQALKFAEEVWELLERDASVCDETLSARVRLVERANLALIRVLTSLNLLDRAMERVRLFARTYPPRELLSLATPAKPPIRSTSTVLYNTDRNIECGVVPRPSAASILSNIGGRPLVRLTSDSELVDDSVPPFLTFKDLGFLHHRLVAANRPADVSYLTWLLKSYSGSLRRRRELTLQQCVARSSSD